MNATLRFRTEIENRRRELNAQLDKIHPYRSLGWPFEDVEQVIRKKLNAATEALFSCGVCPNGRCESCPLKSEVRGLLQ